MDDGRRHLSADNNIESPDDLYSPSSFSTISSNTKVTHEGCLQKWTNYFYGWQKRYVILKGGSLSYCANIKDVDSNFHGVLSIKKAEVRIHPKDDTRFDVQSGGVCYFFKACSPEERMLWITKIFAEKENARCDSRRSGSLTSLSSSSSLGALVTKRCDQVSEAMLELSQIKDRLFIQIDSLQNLYDIVYDFVTTEDYPNSYLPSSHSINCNSNRLIIAAPGHLVKRQAGHRYSKSVGISTSSDLLISNENPKVRQNIQTYFHDKKNNLHHEISSFRTTSVEFMSTLSSSIEVIENMEKNLQAELLREKVTNKVLNKKIDELTNQLKLSSLLNSPDAIEGPNAHISDEEFFDAIETELTHQDQFDRLENQPTTTSFENPYATALEDFTTETLEFLSSPISDESWKLCFNEPLTKIYKKEVLINDIVVDPYKVIHLYKRISARELSTLFWDVKYRLHSDITCERVYVKTTYDPTTVVVHQLHKQIWPAAKRDSCFISKIYEITADELNNKLTSILCSEFKEYKNYKCHGPAFLVVNLSVEHPDTIAENCIRADAQVSFLALTFINPDADPKSRDSYISLINYCAIINPGGWLPHSAVRAVAKRELPKFVKNLGIVTVKEFGHLEISI